MLPVPLLHYPRSDPSRYPPCGTCKVVHPCKIMHIQLDGDGTAIVSERGWQQLQRVPNHGGFRVVNTVDNPPPINVMLPPKQVQDLVEGVDVGGVLALERDSRVHFDIGGNNNGGTVTKAAINLRTVTIEEYFERMARNGYGTERAARILMEAIWRDGPTTQGAQ